MGEGVREGLGPGGAPEAVRRALRGLGGCGRAGGPGWAEAGVAEGTRGIRGVGALGGGSGGLDASRTSCRFEPPPPAVRWVVPSP